MPFPLALAASLLPAAYQGIKGVVQKGQAKRLNPDDYNYIPEGLTMNRDLALQQAYSRRAPGSANAESMIRRSQANQITAGQKTFGADANKLAAIASQATGQANDANARISAQGQQFSEGAFGRLQGANSAIANQQRQNYNDYWQQRNYLNQSGDQNIFNSISNIATTGLIAADEGVFGGKKALSDPAGLGGELGRISTPRARGAYFASRILGANNPGIYSPGTYNPGYDPSGRAWGMPGFNPILMNGGNRMINRSRRMY